MKSSLTQGYVPENYNKIKKQYQQVVVQLFLSPKNLRVIGDVTLTHLI